MVLFLTDSKLSSNPSLICYMIVTTDSRLIAGPGGSVYFRRRCVQWLAVPLWGRGGGGGTGPPYRG